MKTNLQIGSLVLTAAALSLPFATAYAQAPGAPLPQAPMPAAPAQAQAPAPQPMPAAMPAALPPLPTGPLTMQQVVDLALQRNPALLGARQNLASVRAQEMQAAVRQNPYLSVTGQNVTLGQYADNPFYYSIGLGRLFERGNKREWRLDSARSTTAVTEDQLRVTEQQTILAVRQAFSSLVVAKAAKKLADDNLADYRHELQIAQDRFDAGDLAKLDIQRLDLQLAQFESDESNAVTALEQASIQLGTLLGADHPSTNLDVAGEVVPPGLNLTISDLEQRALATRADLQAAQAAVSVGDAQVKLADAYGKADPTLEADYDRNGPDNSLAFSFNIPLRFFDRNQGNKATARYAAQANRFAVVAARNQVVSDVDQAYSAYVNARILADRYNSHYLDEAKDVLEISRFSYEHGGLALIDYLDAVRDSRSVTAAALAAYQQTWQAIHQMSFVTSTNMVP